MWHPFSAKSHVTFFINLEGQLHAHVHVHILANSLPVDKKILMPGRNLTANGPL